MKTKLLVVLIFKSRDVKCHQCPLVLTYIYQEIKDPGVQSLGEGISGVTCLLHIEGHVDGLRLASPLAIHLPACELFFQPVLVYSQKIRRKSQNYRQQNKTWWSFRILTTHFTNTWRHFCMCACAPTRHHHWPPKNFHSTEDCLSAVPHTPIHFVFLNCSITWVNSSDSWDFQ